MNYKGYTAEIEYDEDLRSFHGRVVNIRDVITFYGENVKELEKEFKNSVEDYLAFCKEDGVEAEKPYSGTIYVRTKPEHHRLIAEASAKARMSINQFAEAALIKAAQQSL